MTYARELSEIAAAVIVDSSKNVTVPAGKVTLGSTSLGAGDASAMKNRIINGAMVIDQRNAGASITPTVDGVYSLDRWITRLTQASKYSVQQVADAPDGFINSLKITSLSAYSVNSTDFFQVGQYIEGLNAQDLMWGTSTAKTVTVSFWVKSSLTGTFGGTVFGYQTGIPSYPFSYTISAANTWEQKTITISGPTSGTFNTNNSGCFTLLFSFGVGSSLSGTANTWNYSTLYRAPTSAVSVVGTNAATFQITGVQLEVGTTATNFDYRSYGTELALCQRYYIMQAKAAGDIGNAWYYSGSQCSISFSLPVTMRTTPAVSYASGAYYTIYRNSATNIINDFLIDQPTTNFVTLYNATQASGTAGQSGLIRITNSAGFIAMSAEL